MGTYTEQLAVLRQKSTEVAENAVVGIEEMTAFYEELGELRKELVKIANSKGFKIGRRAQRKPRTVKQQPEYQRSVAAE